MTTTSDAPDGVNGSKSPLTLEERLGRLEKLFSERDTLIQEIQQLDESTGGLTEVIRTTNETRKDVRRILFGGIIAIITAILVAAAGVAYLDRESDLRDNYNAANLEVCLDRQAQVESLKLYAQLEIERTPMLDISEEQKQARLNSLEVLATPRDVNSCSLLP